MLRQLIDKYMSWKSTRARQKARKTLKAFLRAVNDLRNQDIYEVSETVFYTSLVQIKDDLDPDIFREAINCFRMGDRSTDGWLSNIRAGKLLKEF